MPTTTLTRSGGGEDKWDLAHLFQGLKSQRGPTPIKRRDLTTILQHLSTLIENGVPLPKALLTVAQEPSLRKHAETLHDIRRRVESGESFSGALAAHPESFGDILVNQVRVGEKSGTLAETLARVTLQQEQGNQLRSLIIKKLSYPVLLLTMGGGVVTFMLMFVVPVFEETYADANVPLPAVTRFMIASAAWMESYGWLLFLLAAVGAIALKWVRRHPPWALKFDRAMMRTPLLGGWLRDLAVLQFVEVLGSLLEAGFRVAEALGVAAGSVGNRAVRQGVRDLQAAVHRGERFSRELERQGDLFPPVVAQLVIVGERTGNLVKATMHVRKHLRRQIERNTSVLVGTIEPVLTISLAVAIGVILLAIYLPMFDMIGAVTK